MSAKACYVCSRTLPLSDFYRDRSHPDGYASRCKGCSNARSKRLYRERTERQCQTCSRMMPVSAFDPHCLRCRECRETPPPEPMPEPEPTPEPTAPTPEPEPTAPTPEPEPPRRAKPCGRCGEVKSLLEFPRAATAPEGRGNRCKTCVRERARERSAAKPKPGWRGVYGCNTGGVGRLVRVAPARSRRPKPATAIVECPVCSARHGVKLDWVQLRPGEPLNAEVEL